MNRPTQAHLQALGILLLGLAAHLPAVFSAEMTGEDELLFNHIARAMLATLQGVPGAWRAVFSFYYPPMQSLLPAPLVGLFGTSAWTLRLPGALCGAAAAVILYQTLAERGRDRRAAWLAGGLAAVSSVVANHHYALTCGIYSVGAALCAWGLVRFVDAADEREADNGLLLGAVGLVWAMMTLPDAYFHLPVLALAYWSRRGWRLSGKAWVGAGLVAGWIGLYGVCWFLLPSFFSNGLVGGHHKTEALLSQLGALRLRDLIYAFAAGSSWILLALSVVLLPMGWRSSSRGQKWMAAFYAFPLLLWTFVFDYPNVRAAHMLLAFPGYALLWANGACRLCDLARSRSVFYGRLVRIGIALAVATGVYQTAMLHVADVVPENRMGPRWLVLRGYYPQGRRVEVLGQHAAGWWVRQHSTPEDGVCSNLGGAFADVYAARPHVALAGLPDWAHDPESARRAGVRFYAHSLKAPAPMDFTVEDWSPALEVQHRNQPILRVYDLWREHSDTHVLEAGEGRRLWCQLNPGSLQ